MSKHFICLLSDKTFEGFLVQIVDYWNYFLGYGFPLGLLTVLFPHFIGWGGIIIVMMYPILVIGALAGSHWRPQPSTDSLDEKFKLPHLLRLVILMSMRPSLLITNLIVRFGAWIVYHFWFKYQDEMFVQN